jgi:hypothetical protein
MKRFKENLWTVCMLVGISLLTVYTAIGKCSYWQMPTICAFVIIGLTIDSTRN